MFSRSTTASSNCSVSGPESSLLALTLDAPKPASRQFRWLPSVCPLIQLARLICDFCSSGQRFACGFLQIPPRDGHPCRPANSPCRVRRRLSLPSKSALPGAPTKHPRYPRMRGSLVNVYLECSSCCLHVMRTNYGRPRMPSRIEPIPPFPILPPRL